MGSDEGQEGDDDFEMADCLEQQSGPGWEGGLGEEGCTEVEEHGLRGSDDDSDDEDAMCDAYAAEDDGDADEGDEDEDGEVEVEEGGGASTSAAAPLAGSGKQKRQRAADVEVADIDVLPPLVRKVLLFLWERFPLGKKRGPGPTLRAFHAVRGWSGSLWPPV